MGNTQTNRMNFEETLIILMDLIQKDLIVMVWQNSLYESASYGRLAQIREMSQEVTAHFLNTPAAINLASDEIMELALARGDNITGRITLPKKSFLYSRQNEDGDIDIYLSGHNVTICVNGEVLN